MKLPYNIAGFELPSLASDHLLQRILTAALPDQNNCHFPDQAHYWNADFFNLDRVKIFQESTIDEQLKILAIVNLSLLRESYFIEKAGVGYMAKMVLLAETIEERIIYGLFVADEATHLKQIMGFLPEMELNNNINDPFLILLSEVIESSDKAVLLFVLQVVLEGWGLSHYRSLGKGCRNPILAAIFSSFLQAESRHHGTGTTLFNQTLVSASSQGVIIDILTQFLLMVQVGPQSVLAAIEQVKGHLTKTQKITILEELDTENHSGTRLKLLRSLMNLESAKMILQTLDERGVFQPFSASKCIKYLSKINYTSR
jgi:hypothetical protein